MKAVGIVAEYNPFHNGHKYMLEKALSSSGASVSVAAISGDFSQRGEPMLIDKWDRAEMIVRNGVDLVCEIPTIFACNNAGYFAKAGVEILDSLSVDSLSFGISVKSEEEIEDLGKVASLLRDHGEEIEEKIRPYVREGLSYPKARMIAVSEMIELSNPEALSLPNNILAVEYMKNTKAGRVIPVLRKSAEYYDTSETDGISSATHIREKLAKGEDISHLVPKETLEFLSLCKPVYGNEKLFDLIMSRLMSVNENLDSIFGLEEGLSNILKRDFRSFKSYDDIIESLKSKRYTRTRNMRSMINLLLGITKRDVDGAENFVRVLAMNENGAKYLKEVKKAGSKLPIITNINKDSEDYPEIKKTLEFDIKASDLYNAIAGKDLYENSDFVKHAVRI